MFSRVFCFRFCLFVFSLPAKIDEVISTNMSKYLRYQEWETRALISGLF